LHLSCRRREGIQTETNREIDEFKADLDQEELADILEVIHALGDIEEIEKIRVEKLNKRGGLKKELF